MTDLAAYLSSKRKEKGISLRTLAKGASMTTPVHYSTLCRLERGKRAVSAQDRPLLLALGKVLDLGDDEVNELLTIAGLTPITGSESNLDKILELQTERWRKTRLLMDLGWHEGQICRKLNIPFWEVRADIKLSEASTGTRLILSLLEHGRRVWDFEKHQYARLVSFRLGNISEALLIVESITLSVTECGTHNREPETEAAVTPYRFDVELSLDNTGESEITKTKFKLARFEVDDYEVLFKSSPGNYFRGSINVYYTRYPETELLTVSSQPLELVFPNVSGARRHDSLSYQKLVAGSEANYLQVLSNRLKQLSEGEHVELRIYVQNDFNDSDLRQLETELVRCGIMLNSPVVQDAGIILIRFTYLETTGPAISSLTIPDIMGWQLFDAAGRYIQGIHQLTQGVMVIEDGSNPRQ